MLETSQSFVGHIKIAAHGNNNSFSKLNNYSDLNQSGLRKTENPRLSGYGHCASVRNITET